MVKQKHTTTSKTRADMGTRKEGNVAGEENSEVVRPSASNPTKAVALAEGFFQEVIIDNRSYNVNYGTAKEFTRLLEECATKAATDIPRAVDPVKYFFQCIHCGDTTFTNKMRLNHHRFMSQCPAVKDDTGNPMRLLPYPDQGRGQGKMSEMMRKGKAVDVEAKVVRKKGSSGCPTSSTVKVGGSTDKNDAQAIPKGKNQTTSMTTTTDVAKQGTTKHMMSEVQKDVAKTTKGSTHAQACKEVVVQKGGRRTSEDKRPKQKTVRFSEDTTGGQLEQVVFLDSDHDDSTGDFQEPVATKKKKNDAQTPSTMPSLRQQTPQQDLQGHHGGVVHASTGSVKAILTRIRSKQKSSAAAADPVWSTVLPVGETTNLPSTKKRKIRSKGDGPVQSQVPAKHCKAQTTPPTKKARCKVVLSDSSEDRSLGKHISFDNAQNTADSHDIVGLHPSLHDGNEEAQIPLLLDDNLEVMILTELNEDPSIKGTTGENSVHHHEGKEPNSVDPTPQPCSSPAAVSSPQSSPTLELVQCCQGPPQSAHEASPVLEHERGANVLCSPNVTPLKKAAKKQGSRTMELAIVEWTGSYERNHELHRYWLCGKGSPKSKMHHEKLAYCRVGRGERLNVEERVVRIAARVKANDLAKSCPKPEKPVTQETPDVYHLLKIRPQLLEWVWEGQSEMEFKEKFAEAWDSQTFQAATKECVVWWSCEAKEEDYPGVFMAVGRAVKSLCDSVKYGHIPRDISLLGMYLQNIRDLTEYEEKCRTHAIELKAEQERIVEEAITKFRHATRMKREEIVWDWCPIWYVVSEHKKTLEKFPLMPWRHDDEEAEAIRRLILLEPLPRVRPTAFVQVLRIALHNVYGRWRLMTCPIFGLSRSLVRTLCYRQRDIMMALSIFTFQAPFQFSGMASFEWDVVHTNVLKDAQLICEGKGDRVLDSIVHWLQHVRIRALQDLARDYPVAFRMCWMTTMHEHWGDQAKYWMKCLSMREDCDLGWVAMDSVPKWSSKVRKARAQIKELVNFMEVAFQEDEDAVWAEYHASTAQCSIAQLHEILKADSAAEPEALSADLLTLSQLQSALNVDDICTQDLQMQSQIALETPVTLVGLVCKDVDATSPGMRVVQATPRSLCNEFATLTRSAEEAVPVFTGPVSSHNTRTEDSLLETVGEVHRGAEMESLAKDDESSDDKETMQDLPIVKDPDSAQRVRSRKNVTFPPLTAAELPDKYTNKLSIPKTYDYFKIDDLIKALPRKGTGDMDAGIINFFGSDQYAVPVEVSQVQDLRSARKYLGQNIVDLLCRRLWWSMSLDARSRTFVASSFIQGPLVSALESQSDKALVKWGRQYLVPSRMYSTCSREMEVVVPYVADLHWSVFILTETSLLHLDSANLHTKPKHKEYATQLWKVWAILHEPPLTLQPVMEKVPVFRQRGNYECGFFVLRFIEQFIRLVRSAEPSLESSKAQSLFRAELMTEVKAATMQKNVIGAIADELGLHSICDDYELPFRVTYKIKPGEGSPLILTDKEVSLSTEVHAQPL